MKKEFKICTVVQGKNLELFLKNLKGALASANMVELRADSIANFKIEDVATLKRATKLPSIFTFRYKKEGGLFTGDIAKQNNILKKAFELGFTFVDVAHGNPILKKLNEKEKTRLLLSWHNNKGTPSESELYSILNKMRRAQPAIIKMATFINHWQDIATLVSLLKKRKSNEKLVVIGMGEKGKITRLTFPLMGSHIAYVTIKGEKSIAPGILTEGELQPMIRYFNE